MNRTLTVVLSAIAITAVAAGCGGGDDPSDADFCDDVRAIVADGVGRSALDVIDDGQTLDSEALAEMLDEAC